MDSIPVMPPGLSISACPHSLIVPVMGFLSPYCGLTRFLLMSAGNNRSAFDGALSIGGVLGTRFCQCPLFASVGACSMVINGTNAILLSTLPMKYGAGKSSTLAGYLISYSTWVRDTIITVVISMWGWAAVAPCGPPCSS